jgi:hypothetical protein
MAAKPSELPRWADTVSGDTDYVVEPTEGKKDVGYAVQEKPTAQGLNWILYKIYEWLQYLSDQVFEGDVETDGTFITPEAGILHGERTIVINAAAAYVHTATADANWYMSQSEPFLHAASTDPSPAFFALPLAVGDRIKSVSARVRGVASGSITFKLYSADNGGTESQIGSTQTSGTAGSDETLSVTGLTTTCAANTSYYLELSKVGATGVTPRIYYVTVTFDRVA